MSFEIIASMSFFLSAISSLRFASSFRSHSSCFSERSLVIWCSLLSSASSFWEMERASLMPLSCTEMFSLSSDWRDLSSLSEALARASEVLYPSIRSVRTLMSVWRALRSSLSCRIFSSLLPLRSSYFFFCSSRSRSIFASSVEQKSLSLERASCTSVSLLSSNSFSTASRSLSCFSSWAMCDLRSARSVSWSLLDMIFSFSRRLPSLRSSSISVCISLNRSSDLRAVSFFSASTFSWVDMNLLFRSAYRAEETSSAFLLSACSISYFAFSDVSSASSSLMRREASSRVSFMSRVYRSSASALSALACALSSRSCSSMTPFFDDSPSLCLVSSAISAVVFFSNALYLSYVSFVSLSIWCLCSTSISSIADSNSLTVSASSASLASFSSMTSCDWFSSDLTRSSRTSFSCENPRRMSACACSPAALSSAVFRRSLSSWSLSFVIHSCSEFDEPSLARLSASSSSVARASRSSCCFLLSASVSASFAATSSCFASSSSMVAADLRARDSRSLCACSSCAASLLCVSCFSPVTLVSWFLSASTCDSLLECLSVFSASSFVSVSTSEERRLTLSSAALTSFLSCTHEESRRCFSSSEICSAFCTSVRSAPTVSACLRSASIASVSCAFSAFAFAPPTCSSSTTWASIAV
mmetsp:Transcript_49551/g.117873  ORF Transcript_49551/g.117873 Transcript_49551/m.117873 type:complete len:645 (-) Transcript_49551:2162-4096(-)